MTIELFCFLFSCTNVNILCKVSSNYLKNSKFDYYLFQKVNFVFDHRKQAIKMSVETALSFQAHIHSNTMIVADLGR